MNLHAHEAVAMVLPSSQTLARSRNALALLFFLVAVVLWTALFTTARFEKRDAYDYAQLGRQIRSQEGFSTRQIFPRYIPYLSEKGYLDSERWPSLHRYPALPVAAAFFQLFIPDIVVAAVVETGVFFLLSVPLLFLLAARISDLKVASLATLVYLGDPRIVRGAYDGMTESLAILLLLLVAHAVFRLGTLRGQSGSWLLIGVLCGTIYLTRTQLVFVLPLTILFALVALEGRRLRSSLLVLAAMIVTIAPWQARNYAVVGDPFFSFNTTRALLARTDASHRIDLVLDAPVDFLEVIRTHGPEIGAKIGHNLWPSVVDPSFWFQVLGFYALCFPAFVIGLIADRRQQRLVGLFETSVVVFCLASFLMVSTTYHRPRYYETLIPFIIILLARRARWLIEVAFSKRAGAAKKLEAVAMAMLFLLAGYRVLVTFSDHSQYAVLQPHSDTSFQALADIVKPESIIASDLSLEITVHNGNRTVRLPSEPGDILEIDGSYLRIDYLVISEHVARRDHYRRFVESADFRQRYRMVTRLPNQARVYVRTVGTAASPSGRERHSVSQRPARKAL